MAKSKSISHPRAPSLQGEFLEQDEQAPEWWRQGLDHLSQEQWELLCDGCGLCCLHKLEDEDTGEYHYTQLACELLDTRTCRCRKYDERFQHVPDCMKLTPSNYRQALPWLPGSCAYKRVAEGKNLPAWHHLHTGSRHSIHEKGASVAGKVRSAKGISERDYQEYLLHWVDLD